MSASAKRGKNPREDKRLRAFHEAAHAVAAVVLGFKVLRVSIGVHAPGSLGQCEIDVPVELAGTEPRLHRDPPYRDLAERYCIYVLSGYLGEEFVTRKPTKEWFEDHQIVNDTIANWFPDPVGDWWVRELGGSPEERKALTQAWESYAPLASGYLEWLKARARTLLVLPRHRRAVEVLAARLLEAEQVPGDEATMLIHAAQSSAVTESAG